MPETDAQVFCASDRRAFLLAAMDSGHKPFRFTMNDAEWFALAPTEHQARLAVSRHLFPEVARVRREDMQRLMCEELENGPAG